MHAKQKLDFVEDTCSINRYIQEKKAILSVGVLNSFKATQRTNIKLDTIDPHCVMRIIQKFVTS